MTRRDLAAIWTVLESSPPTVGVEAVGTGYEVAAGEFLAGLDAEGRRCLLIPLLPGEAARIDTRGRAVHLSRLQHGGDQYMAVTCSSRPLFSVFTNFSRELVTAALNAASPAKEAAHAFDRWRALFSDAAAHSLVSEERLIGLIGELLTLEDILGAGAPGNLDYWTGPAAEAHDFRTATNAIEVKSTLIREGRIVNVSSIDQLQLPKDSSLFLMHHRLDRDPSGFNLSSLLTRLKSKGAFSEDLEAGIVMSGVGLGDLAAYDSRRYQRVETRMYDVLAYAFPRITRQSFVGSEVPPGTLRISYSIDLTNEPPSPLHPKAAMERLRSLAKEAGRGMDS